MKRFTSFVIALALVLSLCACGSAPSSQGQDEPGAGAGAAPESAPDASPGSAPDAGANAGADAPRIPSSPDDVTITATDIQADSVFNTDGLGYLTIWSDWSSWTWDNPDSGVPAQRAVIDQSGNYVIPYFTDTVGDHIVGDASLRVSDGIISLALDNINYFGGIPLYFKTDGTPAFTLEATESEYTDAQGYSHHDEITYSGSSPMMDGYAALMQQIISGQSYADGRASGGGYTYNYKAVIVDRNGNVTCELPDKFTEQLAIGGGGMDTKWSVDWCGEGLFAFYENSYDANWNYSFKGQGYIDTTGKTVIDLSDRGFTTLGRFSQGLAYVRDGSTGRCGYIDKTGALVIPCNYDEAGIFSSNGMAFVKIGEKWGSIDKTGAQVFPCVYESISDFSGDGVAYARQDGKYGYINEAGETVIPFEYDSAYGAGGGLASVIRDGKCGLVDYNGNVVVPLEYDDITSFAGGVAYAIKDGVIHIIR